MTVPQKILQVLSDGLPHSKKELIPCLSDELSIKPNAAVRQHISNLRKILKLRGETIVCELGYHGQIFYRHVRLLVPVDD